MEETFSESFIEQVVRSSRRMRGKRSLGHAKLEAHIARRDPSFYNLEADQESAERIIRETLRAAARVVTGKKTMDVYSPNGQGVRLRLEDSEFLTFLETRKVSR